MRELPTGTVTFLFTDIEGSTKLLHELGDDYADALAEHRRVLRDAFTRHGGVEVDTQGDAFFVAFARAKDALAAASDSQRALAEGPIRVRMGVHTGEPVVTEEGYVGVDVHKGARIAAAGHGGQVLISQTTCDLVFHEGLRDLGEHRLKDLTAPERIFQLGEQEFPPLKVLFGTNLPVQPTPLVGRERELVEAHALLRRHRVLTLVGPGGSGKTRLALQLAADAIEDFPDGVFWVPLQGVGEPSLVEPAIGRAIGASDGAAAHVGDKRLLLLVDNFEHLIDGAGGVASVVAATPNAKLLVTSREPLRISGEQRYSVEPLPAGDAVALFVERARALDPTFEPDEHVREICLRLDGLPLAIELAAARANVLEPAALAARLEQRLPLLTGGTRDAPERQRTLRSTIEWSHDLLEPAEQEVFRRLAAFAASFAVEAAEAVADASLGEVASLVDKSLLRRWGSGRFGMLETIHEYASEGLEASGEEQSVRHRHAEFFLALAKSAHLTADEADLGQRHELVEPEQDNLRRAINWALESGEVALGLELCGALEQFWVALSPYEGARRIEALLAAGVEVPAEVHARALRVYGGVMYIVGDFERGTALHMESLEAFEALGDERAVAHLRHRLAIEAHRAGDYSRARRLAEESLEVQERFRSPSGRAEALGLLAHLEWDEGDCEHALELALRAAASAAEVGFKWAQVHDLYAACEWSLELGRSEDGERHGQEALRLAWQIRDRQMIVYLLALLARASAERGQIERAGVLWGALEREEQTGPVGQWEAEREAYAAHVLADARPEFERGREHGGELSIDAAVDYALDPAR